MLCGTGRRGTATFCMNHRTTILTDSDHRAAHYADNWEEIREELKRVLSRHYA